MKQKLKDMNVYEKRVIVRFDYNVPVSNGKILDDSKIRLSFETLNFLTENHAKIIILSHFGKVKTTEDLITNTLKIVYNHLKKLLKNKITFIENPLDPELPLMVENMNPGEILLLENIYHFF